MKLKAMLEQIRRRGLEGRYARGLMRAAIPDGGVYLTINYREPLPAILRCGIPEATKAEEILFSISPDLGADAFVLRLANLTKAQKKKVAREVLGGLHNNDQARGL